ncbi:MAG: flavin reductase family protein [Thermotaleaceae bacterium]
MKAKDIRIGLRKIPNPIGLVTAQKNDKKDVTTIAWLSKVSNVPPLIMVSIAKERYIHELIKESGEFAVSILGEEQEELALFCGTNTGFHMDKFVEGNIETERAAYIQAPLIPKAIANFECQLQHTYIAGDHTLFVGEVLAAYYENKEDRPLIMTDTFGTLQF